jgi:ABC-type microcin C transport system permease subunit YejB
VLAAIHHDTKWDHLATGFVVLGISVPTFWLALVAVLIFAVYLGWLPSIGYTRPQEDFVDFLKHLALPMTVVALNIAATVLRFQRQDFLDQMGQDYVRTARAKGLSERLVMWKHVLRNSLITTLTVVGLQMAYLSGLITIVETVFNYPGIGLHDELALLVKSGLTPAQALGASVVNGPAFLRAAGNYGARASPRRRATRVSCSSSLIDLTYTKIPNIGQAQSCPS